MERPCSKRISKISNSYCTWVMCFQCSGLCRPYLKAEANVALRGVCPCHPKRTTEKPYNLLIAIQTSLWGELDHWSVSGAELVLVPLPIRSTVILNYWESSRQSKLCSHQMPHFSAVCFLFFSTRANQEINVLNQTIGNFIWCVWLDLLWLSSEIDSPQTIPAIRVYLEELWGLF